MAAGLADRRASDEKARAFEEAAGLGLLQAVIGPGGIAIMVEVLTDKKSRTVPELKSLFKSNGGTMAEANAVAYLFDKKGLILVEGDNITEDDVMEIALDAGAEDIEKDDEKVFAVKTPNVTANAQPAVMTIHPAFCALDFSSKTPATTPLPRMMSTIVPKNSPQNGDCMQ